MSSVRIVYFHLWMDMNIFTTHRKFRSYYRGEKGVSATITPNFIVFTHQMRRVKCNILTR